MTALRTREERAELIKAGMPAKDIEKYYLYLNGMIVINTKWTN